MKKNTTLIIVAVIAVLAIMCIGKYNSLVKAQEGVTAQWAQVENAYQRRADLIPNLVNTVKGYAKHEESTLTAVVEARAKATSVTVDPANLTEESLASFQAAQNELGGALGRLLAVHEAYPELKADKLFLDLQAQLEGTENRIKVARDEYNKVAQAYNTSIRVFPANIIASIFGFEAKAYFKADEAAQTAPVVSFE